MTDRSTRCGVAHICASFCSVWSFWPRPSRSAVNLRCSCSGHLSRWRFRSSGRDQTAKGELQRL